MVDARIEPSYEGWHSQARALLLAGTPPEQVIWSDARADQPALPGLGEAPPSSPRGRILIPRTFVELAQRAACHRDPERWRLLYRTLWRIVHEHRALLENELDPDVSALLAMDRQVRADVERMKAFVRFRRVMADGGERFVAWHRPDHDVARLAAPHFVDRYKTSCWSILTPWTSVHWDGSALTVGAGVPWDPLAGSDGDEDAAERWRAYYAAAFNPVRVNARKLARDLPERFRGPLPEAPAIPGLVSDAPRRAASLRAVTGGVTVRAAVPEPGDLDRLRTAAAGCRACPLHATATQTVFGEGPPSAAVVLVGEQPGDVEDRRGRPFVGPAGEVLDRALAAAGIPRSDVYVTNAVKHFAFEPRGKRRIHRTPTLTEIRACRPWVEAELATLRPELVVCLGGSAARALLGPQARVMALRGRVITGQAWAPKMIVTLHPSAVLRSGDDAAAEAAFATLVQDLTLAREMAPALPPA